MSNVPKPVSREDRMRTTIPETLESMPVQAPAAPQTAPAARARFFNSGNAFNVKLPPVPAAVFTRERDAAQAASATGFIACDQSAALGAPFAATTPLMLARYAVIAPNQTLRAAFTATGALWYVIRGSGRVTVGGEPFRFGAGDVFLAPGAHETVLEASSDGALLWLVTNEPQLAFEGVAPDRRGGALVDTVHYPAAEIERQLARVVRAARSDTTSGIALIFASERGEAGRNILPSLTLSLNTVPPGERQRTHLHNSAAVTLILATDRCYSVVGGERCDWSPYATLVTPATQAHSHHNEGTERATFLIVQDGALHYHMRTMGFTFLEPEA